jgi:hypothetical protein
MVSTSPFSSFTSRPSAVPVNITSVWKKKEKRSLRIWLKIYDHTTFFYKRGGLVMFFISTEEMAAQRMKK